ncbi:hypothetical protein F5144DRAFT_66194 [Chaetomium tenue]|uniref:Uncharacterized protein n=1 Tax=Chaetomium tenue TaxID=1854479 RepID=A0ACB7PPV0_9PEZI|nr:hypothetical protein F5144DRAFT_66194 [Chaetomium globosum]
MLRQFNSPWGWLSSLCLPISTQASPAVPSPVSSGSSPSCGTIMGNGYCSVSSTANPQNKTGRQDRGILRLKVSPLQTWYPRIASNQQRDRRVPVKAELNLSATAQRTSGNSSLRW